MEKWISIIENSIDEIMVNQYEFPPIIYEAMRYSLMMGGKRLRPMIILSCVEAVGGDYRNALDFACAMEMIHTYSLIHDDLPAMDDDDFRRGKLTNHKVYGENMAILAGDGLLTFASEVMAEACVKNVTKENVLAMKTILNGAGVNGMLVGQVVDVYYENKPITKEILDFIHTNKTAKMIASSFKSGAILGCADEKVQNDFYEAGEKIGVAFQIIDDVLDVTSTNEVLGKPIGSDEKNNKTTYVTLFGVEKSIELARELSEQAILLLENSGQQCDFLVDLTRYLTKRLY